MGGVSGLRRISVETTGRRGNMDGEKDEDLGELCVVQTAVPIGWEGHIMRHSYYTYVRIFHPYGRTLLFSLRTGIGRIIWLVCVRLNDVCLFYKQFV